MESTYMTAQEVADALNISMGTVYSYVSRGMLRSEPIDESSRVRRYLREDVERLLNRKAARSQPDKVARNAAQSALHWGTPVLESAITLIQDGRLYYRGYDAVDLSQSQSFEDVALLIWGGDSKDISVFNAEPSDELSYIFAQLPAVNQMTRFQTMVPLMGAYDQLAFDLRPERIMRIAGRLIRTLADDVIGTPPDPTRTIAESLANGLGLPSMDAARLINMALILCADHELNASSFTARVVAGTGATPYAVVSAGLASLSGVKHGGMTERVTAFWQEVSREGDAEVVMVEKLRRGEIVPGFGHVLYPDGDVRGRALLDAISATYPDSDAVNTAHQIEHGARRVLEKEPTIDFALVTLVRALGMAHDLPLILFALGRMAGWIGHMIEQIESSQMIRPRATYIGQQPRN